MNIDNRDSVSPVLADILQQRHQRSEIIMKTRSKTNNFIAILIALLLFAIGFALLFVHQQLKSNEDPGHTQTPSTITDRSISATDGVILLSDRLS